MHRGDESGLSADRDMGAVDAERTEDMATTSEPAHVGGADGVAAMLAECTVDFSAVIPWLGPEFCVKND